MSDYLGAFNVSRKVHIDNLQSFMDYDIHTPTRTISLFGNIDLAACEKLVKNLHVLDNASNEPITILLNSDGGEDVQGQAIYHAILSARSHCTIVGMGEVGSIAAAIFQAGDVRHLRPRTEFMIHYGSRELSARTVDFKNTAKVHDENDRWYEDVLFQAIQRGCPSFRRSTLKKWLREDTYFSVEDAIKWGLADP